MYRWRQLSTATALCILLAPCATLAGGRTPMGPAVGNPHNAYPPYYGHPANSSQAHFDDYLVGTDHRQNPQDWRGNDHINGGYYSQNHQPHLRGGFGGYYPYADGYNDHPATSFYRPYPTTISQDSQSYYNIDRNYSSSTSVMVPDLDWKNAKPGGHLVLTLPDIKNPSKEQ